MVPNTRNEAILFQAIKEAMDLLPECPAWDILDSAIIKVESSHGKRYSDKNKKIRTVKEHLNGVITLTCGHTTCSLGDPKTVRCFECEADGVKRYQRYGGKRYYREDKRETTVLFNG